MREHFKVFICVGVCALLLIACSTPNVDDSFSQTYTVTWKNWDGEVLETDTNVKEGFMPHYNGENPTRPDDDEYTYTWYGWTPELTIVTSNQTYTAKYQPNVKTVYHTVSFDTHGGGDIPSQRVKHGDKATKPANPTKTGCEFISWTYKSEVWSFIGYSVTEDMTLDAEWNTNQYPITYNLDGGTNSLNNPSTYTVEDNIVLENPTKTGYTFLGWFDENDTQITSIVAGTTGLLILSAHWNEGNEYIVTLDSNGGEVSSTSINVQYDHQYSLPTPTRLGYTFNGWFDDSSLFSNSGVWESASNKSLIASWEAITYNIQYILNGGDNSLNNPSTYTVEDNIVLENPTKTGYTFLGWFDENDTQITNLGKTIVGNYELSAKWSANLHNLSISSEDESKGTVATTSGNGYSEESITVTATPAEDCIFKGWYHGPTKISDDATYTFTMPTNDYSLVAHFCTLAEEMQYQWDIAHGVIPVLNIETMTVTYGLYPQTNINDSSLISTLNGLTTPESNGWYLYNNEYYAKAIAAPRGSNYAFNNGTEIENGNTYWFKCEPITWNILDNDNGEYYLLSSMLLDVHIYDSLLNNYMNSEIRAWLNDDFYNLAFALDNSYIQITTVDNSAATTSSSDNPYICNDTQDNVFLPSYQDCFNNNYGFSTRETRYRETTDYVRAKGAYYNRNGVYLNNGYYWTRSPEHGDSNVAWFLGPNGDLDNGGLYFGDGSVSYQNSVSDSFICVCPAITIRMP